MNARMPIRTYKATVRKAHELYVTLDAAADREPTRDSLTQAFGPLQRSINALRRQTCSRCDERGYDPNPPIPGWNECRHPDVPIYDISTGEEWKA